MSEMADESVGVRFKVDKHRPQCCFKRVTKCGDAGKAGRLMHVPSLDTSVPVKTHRSTDLLVLVLLHTT